MLRKHCFTKMLFFYEMFGLFDEHMDLFDKDVDIFYENVGWLDVLLFDEHFDF